MSDASDDAVAPPPPPGWALRALKSIAAAGVSVAMCVALTVLGVALLPAGEKVTIERPDGTEVEVDRPFTYGQKLGIVRTTIWEKVICPRRPTAEGGWGNWFLTLRSATPLLLTGLAVAVAFRANVLNIGGQGQYAAGAIACTAVAVYLPVRSGALMIPAHLLAAMAGGAIVAAVAAALERWRRVPVVLSTLLLNFVVLEFLRYLLQGPMREPRADPQSPEIAAAARLPEFFAGAEGFGLHLGFFIALAAAGAVGFVLRRTTFGFRLRVVGQNAVAARVAGMNVARVSFATLAVSGALAGLAGGVQVAGVTGVLYPDAGTNGLGFAGIAVALLGRLSAAGVVFSAVFFGLLDTTFKALEQSPLEVHSAAAQGVQGALVLAVLVATSPRWRHA